MVKPCLQRTPDFDVVIKLRNNHLVAFREAMGWSAPQMAEKIGISYHAYIKYESLKESPLSGFKYRMWKDSALKIAEFLKVSPDEVWPEVIQMVKQQRVQLKLDGPRALALAGMGLKQLPAPDEFVEMGEMKTAVHQALETLTPREKSLIERRFGLTGKDAHTLEALSEVEGVSRERLRQIEQKAMRKLRHSSRSARLSVFVEPGG